MLTFLAPGFLWAGVASAAGVVALHFLVMRRARAVPFPTARFIPEHATSARTHALELRDMLLLALRALALLALGAGLARPLLSPPRTRLAHIVVADVSPGTDVAAVRDSARLVARAGDVLVAFDTAARLVGAVDSLSPAVAAGPGALSAGLAAALRAAPSLRTRADSVALVLISPLLPSETDAATAALLARWPGRARWVRVSRAIRDTITLTPVVLWNDASRPRWAAPRDRLDTAGAVVVPGGAVIVAPFVRRWAFPADSLAHARVLARWSDGEPAAIERAEASTCTRSIAIPVDSTGDLPIRTSFRAIIARLYAPCTPLADTAGVPPRLAAMLSGSAIAASATAFPPPPASHSSLAPWFVGVALALLAVEPLFRRRHA